MREKKQMTFTPLQVRSAFSLLRGSALPETLVPLAAECGYRQLALTDVNMLGAATRFHQVAEAAGLTPIIGAELEQETESVLALVETPAGYSQLCRIISRLHQPDPAPLVQLVGEHADGLQVIARATAQARGLQAAGVPRDRLWLSLDGALARGETGQREFPLIATGQVLMGRPDERELTRLLTAIRLGTTFERVERAALPSAGACLAAPDVYARRYAEFPEALVHNQLVAEACGGYRLLPREPVFPGYECPRGLSSMRFLRQLCEEGLRRRYGQKPPPQAKRRLERELNLIAKLGFVEYFLVVWDIVQFARRRRAPVAGRGSGASSLVAYLLEITNVCPLHYEIPFERFLHEEREDFPDLDVDFCWRIRDDVLNYAFRRWGHENVAMVSSHVLFQERSAVRETLKAFGFSNEQVSELDPEALAEDNHLAPTLALAKRLVGLPHHLSVHPGGIVIGRQPIDHYAPVQAAPKGVTITQYDKDGIEAIGLVKLDLLGNRNLSTVRYACDLIQQRRNQHIDIEALPTADPETIAMLQAGDSVGCNQLESPAMRHLLQMMQPRDTLDVMKVLALIRPGAASIGMKEVFVRRHRGLEPTPAGYPPVDAILAGSHGVMVYEDDVMLVAAAMLGTSRVEGDRFRRAVQKCRTDEERLALSEQFLTGCQAHGLDLDYAKEMWIQMAKYNNYSFCRAHAASYGVLSYAGAWLKTHYPLEFWTAALNNNQSMYPHRVYVEQAKRDGIRFLLPDVNVSGEEFQLEGNAIRVGLNSIKGLGPQGVATILRARRAGPFASVRELMGRTQLGAESVRSLILCGALDALGAVRPALIMELTLCEHDRPALVAAQGELFAAAVDVPKASKDYQWQRKYIDERRILGFSVRRHLMSLYREWLGEQLTCDSRELSDRIGQRLTIAGFLETRQGTRTRHGEAMMFATFDDEFGLFDVTIFPDLYQRIGHRMTVYGPYLIKGRVNEQYGAISLDAESIVSWHPACNDDELDSQIAQLAG